MKFKTLASAAVMVLTLGMGYASASPITYLGTLSNGVPVGGINMQAPVSSNNPVGADYWRFFATAGSALDIFVDRLAGHYDPAMWTFLGLFADTNDFGATISSGDTGFADFADDEDAPNIAGPFGDPHATFLAPATGFYTLIVTNFVSNQGPPNPYTLTARGIGDAQVPEPGSMMLLASGLVAWAIRQRRRNQK